MKQTASTEPTNTISNVFHLALSRKELKAQTVQEFIN